VIGRTILEGWKDGAGQHRVRLLQALVAGELEPKPSPAVYDRFLKVHGVDPARAAMFEDLARNLAVPHRLGMTTVLVVPENTREVFREDWELEGRNDPHVDHVTDDLACFLESIAARR